MRTAAFRAGSLVGRLHRSRLHIVAAAQPPAAWATAASDPLLRLSHGRLINLSRQRALQLDAADEAPPRLDEGFSALALQLGGNGDCVDSNPRKSGERFLGIASINRNCAFQFAWSSKA